MRWTKAFIGRFLLKGGVDYAVMISLENPSRSVRHEKDILSDRPAKDCGREKQCDELDTL